MTTFEPIIGGGHPFDQSIALAAEGEHRWLGRTSPAYANMVGPFGGTLAAQALNGVLLHSERLGEPVAFTVNFAAPMADGEFVVMARPARTNRSTQHWLVELRQGNQTVLTASAVTALRRETWSADDLALPAAPRPQDTPRSSQPPRVEWARRYEMRFVDGSVPDEWKGRDAPARTLLWLRDDPPRPLDFASLTAMADAFFPRIFLKRGKFVPIGTVSMTTYFLADAAQLEQVGDGYLLGDVAAAAYRNGYFDQTAHLWSEPGVLLASSHQVVYYKE